MRLRAEVGLAALALLGACSRAPDLALHQSVVVAGAGTPDERRLEVWEDPRISPALRRVMWGGPKDPAALDALPTSILPQSARDVLAQGPFRRAALRLTDRDGHELGRRLFDCELGEIAQPALPQGDRTVWGVGDDCSTGEGDYAGLITRLLPPPGDRIVFEQLRDARTGAIEELTLVSAHRIAWHLEPHGEATGIREVSSHPDFDDPAVKALPPGAPLSDDVPRVTEFIRLDWDAAAAIWVRHSRREPGRIWSADEEFPDEAAFPQN